jgi:ABC-type bacteriocin/lantibiotic exporter with double-glycine peptidase domain
MRHIGSGALLYSLALMSSVCSAQDPPNLEGAVGVAGQKIEYLIPKGLDTPQSLQYTQPFQKGRLCGPNAVYIVLQLYGKRTVSYSDIVNNMKVSSLGASLQDLVECANRFGVACEARKQLSPTDLINAPKPIIVHIAYSASSQQEVTAVRNEEGVPLDHFVVITGWDQASNLFYAIDTTNLRTTYLNGDSIARTMSGYGVVPKKPSDNQTIGWWQPRLWLLIAALALANALVRVRLMTFKGK